MRQTIFTIIGKFLARQGYTLARQNPSGVEPLQLWLSDSKFMTLWDSVCNNTMIDISRAYMLYQFLSDVGHLDGAAAEVGVWRGGTGQMIEAVLAGKPIYLYDTFAGLPAISPEFDHDFHVQGEFSDTSYEYVKSLFSHQERVNVIKGVFPHSLEKHEARPSQYCFVHVDVDLYQSAKDCCEYFYDRLVLHGVMIFDDYGFGTCPGVRRAVDEFFRDRQGHFYLPTGQYIALKTSS